MFKSLVRFIFGRGLIFLAGLLVGLAFFTPWESVWNKALKNLDRRTEGVVILWDSIEDASFSGVKLKGLMLRWPKYRLQTDSTDFRLGLLRPLKATIETGTETLDLAMSWGKILKLAGAVEIGTFLDLNRTTGKVAVDGFIDWEILSKPPVAGKLSLNSPSLTWEGKTTLDQFALDADLERTLFNLTALRFVKPLPMVITGNFELDWVQLAQSIGEVEGSVEIGGKTQNFNKKGTLGQLLKQAGM